MNELMEATRRLRCEIAAFKSIALGAFSMRAGAIREACGPMADAAMSVCDLMTTLGTSPAVHGSPTFTSLGHHARRAALCNVQRCQSIQTQADVLASRLFAPASADHAAS